MQTFESIKNRTKHDSWTAQVTCCGWMTEFNHKTKNPEINWVSLINSTFLEMRGNDIFPLTLSSTRWNYWVIFNVFKEDRWKGRSWFRQVSWTSAADSVSRLLLSSDSRWTDLSLADGGKDRSFREERRSHGNRGGRWQEPLPWFLLEEPGFSITVTSLFKHRKESETSPMTEDTSDSRSVLKKTRWAAGLQNCPERKTSFITEAFLVFFKEGVDWTLCDEWSHRNWA